MDWIPLTIYCFLFISPFILDRVIKKKFHLPKKLKFTKRFNNTQIFIEVLIGIIFIIGVLIGSYSVYDSGEYRSLNPIPIDLWYSLFMFVLFSFRGYMIRKFAKESREYYLHFAFALWTPIVIIVAYRTTKFFWS